MKAGWRLLLALVLAGALFVAGLGLGEALHDGPQLAGDQTYVGTIRPLRIPLVSTETVTVTASGP